MIGYVTLGTNDLPRAAAFYDALLGEIGAKRAMGSDRFIAWGVAPDKPMLGVIKPYDGKPATVGNGVMVALAVDSQATGRPLTRRRCSSAASDEGARRPARRRLLRRLLPRSRRQQAERVCHGLSPDTNSPEDCLCLAKGPSFAMARPAS